jgi:hypothetical protein
MLLENTKAELIERDIRIINDRGRMRREQTRTVLVSVPLLVVTDTRLVFLEKDGTPKYEAIYDLPYLHTYLPILKRWNDQAEEKIGEAQVGESALKRWFTSGSYRKKYGLTDCVNMIGGVQHPRGLLGPKNYLILKEATFRPVAEERMQELKAQDQGAGVWQRLKDSGEEARLGRIFYYRPAYLYVHEKDTLDAIASALYAKVDLMNNYLGDPGGLQREYEIPASQTQGFADFHPPDLEGT